MVTNEYYKVFEWPGDEVTQQAILLAFAYIDWDKFPVMVGISFPVRGDVVRLSMDVIANSELDDANLARGYLENIWDKVLEDLGGEKID